MLGFKGFNKDPAIDFSYTGESVLFSVINSSRTDTTENHKVKSGVIGLTNHRRIVYLINSAAKATADALGDCKECRTKAAVSCVGELVNRNRVEEEESKETATADADC